MAVCRFSDDSDVYVFYSTQGGLECCGCRFLDRADHAVGGYFNAATERDMLEHLQRHKDAGHKVPAEAFDRLIAEQQ
jgi:hypothetical protein